MIQDISTRFDEAIVEPQTSVAVERHNQPARTKPEAREETQGHLKRLAAGDERLADNPRPHTRQTPRDTARHVSRRTWGQPPTPPQTSAPIHEKNPSVPMLDRVSRARSPPSVETPDVPHANREGPASDHVRERTIRLETRRAAPISFPDTPPGHAENVPLARAPARGLNRQNPRPDENRLPPMHSRRLQPPAWIEHRSETEVSGNNSDQPVNETTSFSKNVSTQPASPSKTSSRACVRE